MLQFLVTSKVRRRLLSLLWGEEKTGAVAELAAMADVAFAGAHAELKAMQRAQLVVSQQERGREVFAANVKHPQAELLRALVAGDTHQTTASAEEDEPLRRRLVALGAPLRGLDSLTVEPSEQMSTLVEGVRLARRDPVVARSLPLCFWRLRDALDMKALAALAFRPEDRHALGFMLELTGELGGDRRLVGLAESLRDRRITLQRDFFQMFRRDAVIRDFPIAAKWGFRMNMDIDSFRTLFDKFKRVPT